VTFPRVPTINADWMLLLVSADVNNDNWPDILGSYRSPATLYRNLGTNGFMPMTNAVPPIEVNAAAFGDADNDGWPDLLLAGSTTNGTICGLFRNSGTGNFAPTTVSLPYLLPGQLIWADIDNDNDLDFLATGVTSSESTVRLYRNDTSAPPNPAPEPPRGLRAFHTNGVTVFSWEAAIDANQTGGHSYNLRVGTKPGRGDTLSPMSLENGQRLLPGPGNASLSLKWLLYYLPPGTYYWTVQAIDHGFRGSPFAEEQTIVIPSWFNLTAEHYSSNRVQLTLSGRPKWLYTIDVSSDLDTWTVWYHVALMETPMIMHDILSPESKRRYYRVTLLE